MTYSNVNNIILQNGDRVLFNDKIYKIMFRKDYSYMLPQLGFSLSRYIKNITLKKVITAIVDEEAVTSYADISFRGLVQPLKYSELYLLTDEQRAWVWLKISTFSLTGNMDYYLVEDYKVKQNYDY